MPPGGIMPSASSSGLGQWSSDVYWSPDDTYYLGYDSVNDVNGRPREIRFTRTLKSEYAHGIGASPAETNGLILRNTSVAAPGAQQYSPSIYLAGQGWKTNATAASQEVMSKALLLPPGTSCSRRQSVEARTRP